MVGRAEYGSRTRLPGLGSPCTTDVLIPLVDFDLYWSLCFCFCKNPSSTKSRYPDSNRGPTHYECVALPTEPYRQKRMQRYIQKMEYPKFIADILWLLSAKTKNTAQNIMKVGERGWKRVKHFRKRIYCLTCLLSTCYKTYCFALQKRRFCKVKAALLHRKRAAFATSKRNCRFSREFSLQNESDFKCLFGAGKWKATCRQLRGMDIK